MDARAATVASVPAGEVTDPFTASRLRFEELLGWAGGPGAGGLTHAQLEDQLGATGRELLRQLLADHLQLRASTETRMTGVTGADGHTRRAAEPGHTRALQTVFGVVTVNRIAYRGTGLTNLHPADAALNLPPERASHGLRELAAIHSASGSFEQAAQAITRATGQTLGKRQIEHLAAQGVADFESFYQTRRPPPAQAGDVIVLSADGKGIVMRHDGLRPSTARAAANTHPKLATRLSKGEKRNRKRMAEVGAVYDTTPVPRTTTDILPATDHDRQNVTTGPRAANKWLTASVTKDTATVITDIFAEAGRRDPQHTRAWIALVDGNNHQIQRINHEASTREVNVAIIIDFIHVLEYLWKAAWSFHAEGDPAAEKWVRHHAEMVLNGRARVVAANLRRAATKARLPPTQRAGADTAAKYLTAKAPYLDYPTALGNGWPIATGIIEGACRHLVKDRMDITGARWGLSGAENILRLRAITCNGDFPAYWEHHLTQEHTRNHQNHYAHNSIPQAA